MTARLIFLLLPLVGYSQSWEFDQSFAVGEDITAYSFDDQGSIYVGTSTGTLSKFGMDGSSAVFAYPNSGGTTLIEGRNPLLPFIFFRDNQQAIVLDRFMSNPVVYDIRSFASGFAWLATPAMDRHIWLLKTSPLTILKVDPLSRTIIQSTPLLVEFPLTEVVFFKAQRNLLIVVDKVAGVWIFDLFGNPMLTVPVTNATYAHIDGQHLITYSEGLVISQLLSKEAKPIVIDAPKTDYQAVIRRRSKYYFVGRRQVDTFSIAEE